MAVDKVHRTPPESGRGLCRGLNAEPHFKCGDNNAPYANGVGHDSLGLGCVMHIDPTSKNIKMLCAAQLFLLFLNLKQE